MPCPFREHANKIFAVEIKEIRRQDFAASLFELPSGLQKKETP